MNDIKVVFFILHFQFKLLLLNHDKWYLESVISLIEIGFYVKPDEQKV